MNNQAKQLLKTLAGHTVRVTVETNELLSGTVAFEDFKGLDDMLDGDTIKGQVQFKDCFGNYVTKINQKLVKILKIEIFYGDWVEKFNAKK